MSRIAEVPTSGQGTTRTVSVDEAHDLDSAEAAQEQQLLTAVDELAPLIREHAGQAAAVRRLTDEVAAALRDAGLWRMRLARELGGEELSTLAQIRVIAALAAVDPSTAWCTMVVNNGTARAGATMPDAAVERIFANGVPVCSVVVPPGGVATPVDGGAGGYRVTGTWRFASAIGNADWLLATALVDRDPSRQVDLLFPATDLTVLETWDADGLRATGSQDVSLENYLVPAELTGNPGYTRAQLRGRRRHDRVTLDVPESYEHLAFATGVGRAALDQLHDYLASPASGARSDLQLVHTELGRATVQLRAIHALSENVFGAYDHATLSEEGTWPVEDRGLPRALATWATRLALDWARLAREKSGFDALRAGSRAGGYLEDMTVAAAHIAVDERALTRLAEQRVEDSVLLDPADTQAVTR